jgi:hypothetical protein
MTRIEDIREGVAEFAQRCGISQVEAACELLLVVVELVNHVEAGTPHQDAAEAVTKAFEERWPGAYDK